ncbi:hypothetical protein FDG2_4302 [Candidatus Protofrankia californiensis]|uniref:Uncharacterized protein n=1 Tax=Candidatus Protofrankia californiensis TaxID=1839754 RepID=A0A1C3P4P8_9ACTN|nr:hypothetical protein FDG2_4302 [Candidatus Protofrankia californiensis]
MGSDFAIAPRCNTALWRAYAAVPEHAWTAARDMHGAQVMAVDHVPAGWPPGTCIIIRRVRVDAADICADPRSRRRRTISKDQLTLALDGIADHAWALLRRLPPGRDQTLPAALARLRSLPAA